MANVVAITGRTGTGKSSSIQYLNPEETFINKSIPKPLSFRGSRKMYNKENKNMSIFSEHTQIIKLLQAIDNKMPHIKNLILDDIGHVMINEFFRRARETGYTKYTEIGQHMQQVLETCINMRDDLNIALMFHEDTADEAADQKKIKTVGKLLDNYYDPLETVSVALFTDVSYIKGQPKPDYSFITNRMVLGSKEIPAKSPDGMFEDYKIPNNLKFVFDSMNEYYS